MRSDRPSQASVASFMMRHFWLQILSVALVSGLLYILRMHFYPSPWSDRYRQLMDFPIFAFCVTLILHFWLYRKEHISLLPRDLPALRCPECGRQAEPDADSCPACGLEIDLLRRCRHAGMFKVAAPFYLLAVVLAFLGEEPLVGSVLLSIGLILWVGWRDTT